MRFLTTLSLTIVSIASASQPWQTIVQWDNDLLTGTDDGYTNGARVAFSRRLDPESDSHGLIADFLEALSGTGQNSALDELRFSGNKLSQLEFGIGFSQLMYTPQDPTALTPPPGERPYAGWVGLELSLQTSSESSANTVTLSLGTAGPDTIGEETQEWVHREISDSPIFQGWDSQLPAEITINLHFDHKKRLPFTEHFPELGGWVDGFYEWGGAIGNFRTDAYLGALFRVGYQLPNSHTTPRVQLGSFTQSIFAKQDHTSNAFSIYGYGGTRAYAVAHDITLDGPLFRDWEHSVDSKTFVGELSFGVAAKWKWAELTLSHQLRSDEFTSQKNIARYGSVLFRFGTQF